MTHPFTDQYIAMARAAEEIQAMRDSFDDGDWILIHHPEYGSSVDVKRDIAPYIEHTETVAWLPRLDQLFDLWSDSDCPAGLAGWSAIKMSHEPGFVDLHDPGAIKAWHAYINQFSDWHEAVLALWMREKHAKIWEGGKWVKQ